MNLHSPEDLVVPAERYRWYGIYGLRGTTGGPTSTFCSTFLARTDWAGLGAPHEEAAGKFPLPAHSSEHVHSTFSYDSNMSTTEEDVPQAESSRRSGEKSRGNRAANGAKTGER